MRTITGSTPFSKELISLIKASNRTVYVILIAVYMMNAVIECTSSYLMISITDGNLSLVGLYLALDVMRMMLKEFVIEKLTRKLERQIKEDFMRKSFVKYDKLSFNSKNKSTPFEFNQNLNKATNAVSAVTGWIVPELLEIIVTFISCLIVFITKGLYGTLAISVAVNVIAYFTIAKKQRKKYSQTRKDLNNISSRLLNRMQLLLPLFQEKEIGIDEISTAHNNILDANDKLSREWLQMLMCTSGINKALFVVIGFQNATTLGTYMSVTRSLGQLSNLLQRASRFLENYSRSESDFEFFEKTWTGLELKDQVFSDLELPNELHMTKFAINNGGFILRGDNFALSAGMNILIVGESGAGKSTLVNAMTGRIPGIEYDNVTPEHYHHKFAEFRQVAKEKLPTSKTSIREIFRDEESDELITAFLELCNISDWANNLKVKKGENKFDVMIEEKISGGQKTRLAIASVVYKLVKFGRKVLILDEPEQGMDPELGYKVLINVMDRKKLAKIRNLITDDYTVTTWAEAVTIVVISHLERIKDLSKIAKNDSCKWTQMWKVENHLVTSI
jgi:ABC-type bacteriocin/lantibiotic exporter with double-glycine peptidase domain